MNYIQKLFLFLIVQIKKLVRFFFKKKIIDHVNWYEAKPATFNKGAGHEDFRKGNYRIAFRKYAKRKDLKFRDVFDQGFISSISISLYGGLGDNIQFLRFVEVIKEKYNSYIRILIDKKHLPLYEILERLEYIDKVCVEEKSSSEEIIVSLKSLPYLLDIGLDDLMFQAWIDANN